MRTLLLFFRFIAIGVITVVVAFFVGREALLFYSTASLNNQISTMSVLVNNPSVYAESCKTTFQSYGDNEMLSGFQLRFMDDTTYVMEAVCALHEEEPILIKRGELPAFVKRSAGYSGLFFGIDGEPTVLGIEAFGRTALVGSEGATKLPAGSAGLVSPATSCTGWGFSCCDAVQQIPDGLGAGEKALDCPGRCYNSCKSRPAVLSFRTEPPMDPTSRTLEARRNNDGQAEVIFAFVVSDPDGSVANVVLDYGDGQSESFSTAQSGSVHIYSCDKPAGGCEYTARISVTDNEGNASPQGETTVVYVKI